MKYFVSGRPTLNVHSKSKKQGDRYSSSANAEFTLQCTGDQVLLINKRYLVAPRPFATEGNSQKSDVSLFLVLKLVESVEQTLASVRDVRKDTLFQPVGTMEFFSTTEEASLTYTCYLEENTFWKTLSFLSETSASVLFTAHAANLKYGSNPDGLELSWEIESDEDSYPLEDILFLDSFRLSFLPRDTDDAGPP